MQYRSIVFIRNGLDDEQALRNLDDNNLPASLDYTRIPLGMDDMLTLSLLKPEHVISTTQTNQIWMDEEMLLMASVRGLV